MAGALMELQLSSADDVVERDQGDNSKPGKGGSAKGVPSLDQLKVGRRGGCFSSLYVPFWASELKIS